MKDYNYLFILPNKFKAVGIILVVVCILAVAILKVSEVYLSITFIRVLISVFILGLLLFALSQEKCEDEMVVRARYVSMMHSIVIGVFIAILVPPLLSWKEIGNFLGYQEMALSILVIYIVDFNWFIIKSKHEK
ncbi:MAG: hypothetical protein E6767_09970 [Dysgonomonas sp.]|nr:hypothetical protein [Dysgonomonas sp.]